MNAPRIERFVVTPAEAGRRLDRVCADRLDGLSRSRIQRLNAAGAIRVDGRARPDAWALREGETVEVDLGALAAFELAAEPVGQDIAVAVVYVDEHVVVVNKPPGLVVHPAHGHPDGTLVNALIGRGITLAAVGGPLRPGIVHRLDRDTSGVMVVARTDRAATRLAAAIAAGDLAKTYHAIVVGHLRTPRLEIDAPIGRHPVRRKEMAIVEGGRPARSIAEVVDRTAHFDYIRVTTLTGRTHQIRVHLAHVGTPVAGDPVYGGRRLRRAAASAAARSTFDRLLRLLPRHALHASTLSLTHPVTGRRMTFATALPVDMRAALELIHRKDRIREVSL